MHRTPLCAARDAVHRGRGWSCSIPMLQSKTRPDVPLVWRQFRSYRACQQHMIDKSHVKVAYESDAAVDELSDYYDFSSSYVGLDDDAVKALGVDDDEADDDSEDGWETTRPRLMTRLYRDAPRRSRFLVLENYFCRSTVVKRSSARGGSVTIAES